MASAVSGSSGVAKVPAPLKLSNSWPTTVCNISNKVHANQAIQKRNIDRASKKKNIPVANDFKMLFLKIACTFSIEISAPTI